MTALDNDEVFEGIRTCGLVKRLTGWEIRAFFKGVMVTSSSKDAERLEVVTDVFKELDEVISFSESLAVRSMIGVLELHDSCQLKIKAL